MLNQRHNLQLLNARATQEVTLPSIPEPHVMAYKPLSLQACSFGRNIIGVLLAGAHALQGSGGVDWRWSSCQAPELGLHAARRGCVAHWQPSAAEQESAARRHCYAAPLEPEQWPGQGHSESLSARSGDGDVLSVPRKMWQSSGRTLQSLLT